MMNTKAFRTLGLAAIAFLLSCAVSPAETVEGQTLFGITFASNQLVRINLFSGEATIIGSSGVASYPYGIATRNDRLYTFDQTNDTIREINKISGGFRRTIELGVTGLKGEGDLAFRPSDGVGFLTSSLNADNEPTNDFYQVIIDDNADTGTAVRLGSTGIPIDALAFDGAGTLYGIGQASATLYTINQLTGTATAVGSLGVAMNSPVAGMTFAPSSSDFPNGQLLAAIDDRLYQIDTATGTATPASSSVINFGPFVSSVSGLAFSTGMGTLGNMSSRFSVGLGDNVAIAGLIIRGTAGKRVVLRGIGPSMTTIPGVLADPVIELFDRDGTSLARNDDYGSSPDKTEITNLGLAPGNPKESAILRTLAAGNYTVILSGADNGTGIGLLEVYDVDRGSDSRLANLSARGVVEGGDNTLIGGLIVSGSGAQRVVVRAIGPDLANRRVPNPLPDPKLDIYNADGVLLKSNDNYTMDPDAAEIASNHLSPNDNRDAATLVVLEPGNYTAVVSGAGTANTGIALLESYNLTTPDSPPPAQTSSEEK